MIYKKGHIPYRKVFDIHHIDYDKKNCNPDNLITLCRSCHIKTNYNREYWKKKLKQSVCYLPMTCEILTAGHIKIIRKLSKEDELIVGLLDEKALKGYKKCIVSFEDRKTIVSAIKWVDKVVRQSSLNPYDNLVKYKPEFVVSGDGFEKEELEAIKKAGCKKLDVRLNGEKKGQKLYSSSRIKKLCQ